MDRFKYLIIESRGLETPVIFPCWLGHDEEARGRKVIAAGDILITASDKSWDDTCTCSNEIEISCSGGSQSLGIKSRGKEDAHIIKRMLKATLN